MKADGLLFMVTQGTLNQTIKIPWIVVTEVKRRDDVGIAGQVSGLSAQEVDDELLVAGEEAETGRQVSCPVSHFPRVSENPQGERWVVTKH